jgi:hypothetical protein
MRYIYFLIRYCQWFKNVEGIKAFANQVMNWLMQEILGLSERLKKINKRFSEKISEYEKIHEKLYKHPVVEADEFPAIRSKIHSYIVLKWIFILGEAFFNYFAASALFTFKGYPSVIAKFLFALIITWGSLYIFENLFHHFLFEKPYKSDHKEPRSVKKLIILSILAIFYECLIYYICKVRGLQIEGGNGIGIISNVMMISGMLMPLIAGYFSYELSRYISPYKNTIKIKRIVAAIAEMKNQIITNLQKMESAFKKSCQNQWALLQEFRTYKENYNLKHSIPDENLNGHFSESHRKFVEEAVTRFTENNVIEGPATYRKINGSEIEDATFEPIIIDKLIKI